MKYGLVSLYLVFFLIYRLVISTIGETQTFVIEKNKSVKHSIQPVEILNVRSQLICAIECFKNPICCSSDFDEVEKLCSIYRGCFPETVSLVGIKHMRKKPSADLLSSATPTDCNDLLPGSDNDVYTIYPIANHQMEVYCDVRLESGVGWTVIQRRIDGSTDFNVTWAAYKTGFGSKHHEYWLGNDNINVLTTSRNYTLRFDMEDFSGITAYAQYTNFRVEDGSTNYVLRIGDYSGTAGHSMVSFHATKPLNGMKFSTIDRDNDLISGHCASFREGAWWFRGCSQVNVNAVYDSIYWKGFRDTTPLKSISMKIKPQ